MTLLKNLVKKYNIVSATDSREETTAGLITNHYSVHIELDEEGSSDHIMEIKLPKKIVEGLKGLDSKKEAALRKLLKDAFVKIAQEN
jgi:predicted transcriptional regulator